MKVSVLPLISTQGWGSGLVLPFLCRLLPLSLESGIAVVCGLWSSALNVKRLSNCVISVHTENKRYYLQSTHLVADLWGVGKILNMLKEEIEQKAARL